MRAPVAPSGWPSEMPPPFGLTSSQPVLEARVAHELERDRRERLVDLDHRDVVQREPGPARAPSRTPAGCRAASGAGRRRRARTRRSAPRGSSPSARRARSLAISTAAAPSQIWLELPGGDLAVGQERRLERGELLGRRVAARRLVDREAATPACASPRPRPARSRARSCPRRSRASARRCDSSEYASSSSRERPHSSAITSAEMPCGTICQRSSRRSERSPPFEPIGTRDIISTPAETTRSSWPDQTAAAALKFVCIDEPHWRSTVVPHDRLRPAGDQRRHPADVPALLADLGHAAHLDVLDLARIEVDAARRARSAPARRARRRASPRACRSACRSASGRRRRSARRTSICPCDKFRVTLVELRKNAKTKLLRQVPLFSRCSSKELDEMGGSPTRSIQGGQGARARGRCGPRVLRDRHGTAEVPGEQKLRTLGDGDFFGEISLITKLPRTASVNELGVARTRARDHRPLVRRMLDQSPGIQRKVLEALGERLDTVASSEHLNSRHWPGTPFRRAYPGRRTCPSRTRSLTVLETSTSPGRLRRDPRSDVDGDAADFRRRSISPVCRPARISIPSPATRRGARGAAEARTGPSKRREEAVAGRVELRAAEALQPRGARRVVPPGARTRRSPSAAAGSVESTMSVKSTVASSLGSASASRPRTKRSISSLRFVRPKA